MWLLIDANNWYAADWYAAKQDTCKVFINRLRDVCNMIDELSENNLNRIVLAFDSAESFRREIDPTYKANRRQKSVDYYDMLVRLRKMLDDRDVMHERMEVTTHVERIERPGYEADDVIAALTWFGLQEGERVVICSSDKDLHALLADGSVTQATKIERLTPRAVRANWMNEARLRAKYGVAPHQWLDYRCMVGDDSDGMSGCENIGPVTALKVLKACKSLDGFYENPFKAPIDNGARTRLINYRKDLPQVRQLLGLRADCMDGVAA